MYIVKFQHTVYFKVDSLFLLTVIHLNCYFNVIKVAYINYTAENIKKESFIACASKISQ